MATTYSQENRPLQVTTTLGADHFILAGIRSEEAISTPFVHHLDLRSEDASVSASGLLRSKVSIKLVSNTGERDVVGYVRRFVQLGRDKIFTSYYAEVVPQIWFLSLSSDCRVFQHKSVPDIVKDVLTDFGITDVKWALTKGYQPREYCVQYRETHLDFISRLLEEEGIFYFFEHDAGKCTLVVADGNSATPVSAASPLRVVNTQIVGEDVVFSVRREFGAHTGKVDLQDYDDLQPNLQLLGSVAGKSKEAVYDYPGKFNTKKDAERLARVRLESYESTGELLLGQTDCRSLQSGMRFTLAEHFTADANKEYLIVSQQVKGSGAGTGEDKPSDDEEEEPPYMADFVAIPNATPYVPVRRTPKPIIPGSQTAVVVGPNGEEIWVDKHGRIKVQFHWDRQGKKDDNSSCWVRVASSWAGKAWGSIVIPRIGQEVVVDFLEGDPDRPLVTGSVYNAEMVVPYNLPDNQTKWGLKSRSSKEGGTENFNEIYLEDKKGSEFISVHAEKDLVVAVENDETRGVDHDRITHIQHDDTRNVKEGNDTHTIEQGNQTVQVKQGNQEIKVDQGNQTISIGQGKQETTIQQDQVVHLKMGNQKVTLDMGNQEITLKMGNRNVKLSMGNLSTKLDLGQVSYEAMMGIELKVGQSSIKLDQMGVTIKGMMVNIEGQIQTQIKGLMTQVNGDAMLMVKGGITMIN